MVSSAFTGIENTAKSLFIYLFSESSLLTAHGKLCIDIEKTCLHEYVLGLWPTHKPWAMANLIPIDFLCRRRAKHNLALGLHAILFFQGNVVIFVLGTKTVSGEDNQMALVTVSTNTTVPVCYLEAVCAGMCAQVMRDQESAGNFSRVSLLQGPCLQRAYVYMESGEQVRGQHNSPPPPGK